MYHAHLLRRKVDNFVVNMTSLSMTSAVGYIGCLTAWFTFSLTQYINRFSIRLDWTEHGLTSPSTQYRLSGRRFYRSKDPTNGIKVLKEQIIHK